MTKTGISVNLLFNFHKHLYYKDERDFTVSWIYVTDDVFKHIEKLTRPANKKCATPPAQSQLD